MQVSQTVTPENPWLKRYSIFVAFAVLLLILKGALVTSNDAGLAVPDWPNSFGENMFLFPPSKWTGIIFYEHVHRLLASFIGLLTLILSSWLFLKEKRSWVKKLGALALLLVILQGVLGGLTVLYLLPVSISSSHAVLAQTFFIVMITLAYSQTDECKLSQWVEAAPAERRLFLFALLFIAAVYLQLILGAVMRHSWAGLAVPDFPTTGGKLIPDLSPALIESANNLRSSLGLPSVNAGQVAIHLMHRFFAFFVVLSFIPLLFSGLRFKGAGAREKQVKLFVVSIAALLTVQFCLGIVTLLSLRNPWIASLHVMVGAALLGFSVLLALKLKLGRAPNR